MLDHNRARIKAESVAKLILTEASIPSKLHDRTIEAKHAADLVERRLSPAAYRLLCLVVKESVSRTADPGFDFVGIFPGRHTGDLKIGTPVATLPGAWRFRVSVGTGWPGVCIPWLDEAESVICNFYLSLSAPTIVRADPPLRCTIACCWDVKQTTNNSNKFCPQLPLVPSVKVGGVLTRVCRCCDGRGGDGTEGGTGNPSCFPPCTGSHRRADKNGRVVGR